ncbi:DUF4160 domain-containing protein [Chitinophaga sancti]|uniref:DUF4160 domain-containing protein n=1 Tax=Chitinophaga sancti TaxID=1004 RepID=A0A1K1Q079_9BACT|nr:DUF4160 domain-containing protein [Chitinophaga sancti]WQD61459.1 DUF4160 domain-containing protein [Chitinophaga sancti]WQG92984.1 DUF4160 domain-containing protein [Chitinophaga sancti]SFW53137.1 protein of unknown function [Chitinophaga sancti]
MTNYLPLDRLLWNYIYGTSIGEDGLIIHIREGVGRYEGLIFEMYTNDHNPPHFHVKTKDGRVNASFRIDNCEVVDGNVSSPDLKRIKKFHAEHKGRFEIFWEKKTIKQSRS